MAEVVEQGVPAPQDPAPAPTPVGAPPAPVQPGPWDSDLQAMFADEAVRGQVDQYLRTKIQPRMTQLEQSAAQSAEAQRLYDDIVANPNETMAALAAELNWTPEQVAEAIAQEAAAPAPVDPSVQEAVDYYNQQKALNSYNEQMQAQVAAHPGLDPEDLHAYVVAAEGNFGQAYAMYEQSVNRWNAKHAPAAVPAPPTLGGDAGSTTPPVAPKQQTLHEAIDTMLAGAKPGDPPPIS